MGCTLATSNQIILEEQQAFAQFRRALRAADQQAFDELFANARRHTAAISMAAHALPFESILLAMLVGGQAEIRRLREEVTALRRQVERLP